MKILDTLNLGAGIDQGISTVRELTAAELAFVAGGEGGGGNNGGGEGSGGGSCSGGAGEGC